MAAVGGKYEVMRKLATGGMAEVLLARQSGIQGFEKLVVLKRILPHLAEQGAFVRMFLDEARTAADLRHNNIVSVFEIGEDRGTYFIAMEYLRGQTLRRIDRAAAEAGTEMPLEHVLHIAIDAALGLHYAHEKTDLKGRKLAIVHRDVSPQNIIVTYEGVTKIVDFGIAKATGQGGETRTGTVRGKIAYMSPEQIRGKPLDARSDLFSLAVVLYELSTGTTLFHAPNDLLTAEAVAMCEIPSPSLKKPGYPPGLERILLKALQRDPDARYPSCGAFAQAIEELIDAERIAHSGSRVGRWARSLFEKEINEEEELLSAVGELRAVGSGTAVVGGPPREKPTVATDMARLPREARTNVGNASAGFFVGRAKDLVELRTLLDAERLVTVVGPGGSGKTRLTRRLAEQQADDPARQDSIWLCDLTEARSPEGVCAKVGGVFTIPLTGDKSELDLVRRVGLAIDQLGPTTVVLDSFEAAAGPAAWVLEKWMELAPEARFLVTSREVLHLPGEAIYELGPLSLPVEGAPVEASEAVQLFVACAKQARRDFVLGADAEAVGSIVTQLDGMPLAIELAAARVAVLSPAKLLERLAQRLDLLSAPRGARGPDGAPGSARQTTLRGTIDWSWDLLSDAEKDALAQCSVFHGGFCLESAEAVVRLGPGANVLDVVHALRSKSLLRSWMPDGSQDDMRFGTWRSIATYAAEKLAATGKAAEVQERHALHYLEAAERLGEGFDGPKALESVARMELDLENIIGVLVRTLDGGTGGGAAGALTTMKSERAVRCALAVDPYFTIRGPSGAQLRWLDAAVAAAEAAGLPKVSLARLLERRGLLRSRRVSAAAALEDLQRAVDLAREGGDPILAARVLGAIGFVEFVQGRVHESIAHLRLAVDGVAGKDKRAEAVMLWYLARACHNAGRTEEAQRSLIRSLALHRARGNRLGEAHALRNLGIAFFREGKLEEARHCHERALEIAVEFGERAFEAHVLTALGAVLHEQERPNESKGHYERALALHENLGELRPHAICRGNLGILQFELEELDAARESFEEATRLGEEVGDAGSIAIYLAFLGALLADLDDREESAIAFDRARKLVDEAGDELVAEALSTLRGHLDCARARDAMRAKDADDAKKHLHAGAARMAAALAKSPPDEQDPTGGPPPAIRNEDVRRAVRLLRRALERSALEGVLS